MPNATSKLDILLNAKDNASGAVNQVESSIKGLDQAAGTMSKGMGALLGAAGVAGVGALVTQLGGAAVEMARTSAEAARLETAFDSMASAAGQSGDQMLAAMKQAAHGTVSNTDLIAAANRAMLLGVADSAGEMAQLMDVASARGKAMGESTSQAFSDLVTGLGRMSPMILDNLGITIDAQKAYEDYAKTVGTSSDKLTEAQKKQALLNAVIKDSTDIVAANKAAGDDAASNFERMDAAISNAKEALGQMFSPAIAAIAQSLADSVNKVTDAITSTEIEKASNATAGLWQEIQKLSDQYAIAAAAATAAPLINPEGAAQAQQDLQNVTNQLMAYGREYNKAAAIAGVPLLDLKALQEGIMAFDESAAGLQKMGAAGGVAAAGLGQVGYSADALKEKLAALKAQSDAAIASLNSIKGAAIGKLESAAESAIGIMSTPEVSRIYAERKKKLQEQIDVMKQVGMTDDEIKFKSIELAKVAAEPFDTAVEAAKEAEKENRQLAKSVDEPTKAYQDLLSATDNVLKQALDPGVGVDPDKVLEKLGVPRADAINENARRLADIAQNGLKNQDWLGDFQKQVPDIWKMIRLAQNPQEEAARLLQDFQDGLLTSPIDKEKAKEIIKRQITGEQNMADMANEIAQELAAEMNIPLTKAMEATQKTLGGGAGLGTSAAQEFADGASAALDESGAGGASFVDKFVDQMKGRYSALATAGQEAGKQWGDAFLAKVGNSVPPALIDLLTTLITPEVIARLAQRGSLTGATQ